MTIIAAIIFCIATSVFIRHNSHILHKATQYYEHVNMKITIHLVEGSGRGLFRCAGELLLLRVSLVATELGRGAADGCVVARASVPYPVPLPPFSGEDDEDQWLDPVNGERRFSRGMDPAAEAADTGVGVAGGAETVVTVVGVGGVAEQNWDML